MEAETETTNTNNDNENNTNTAAANGSTSGGGVTAEFDECLSGYVDRESVESHRYYLARRTLMEMLRDRGFSVPMSDLNISLHDFRLIHSQTPDPDRLRFSVTHLSDPAKKVLVMFCGTDSVKLNTVRGITTQIANKDSLSRLILVLQSTITNSAQRALETLPFKVEIFQITDLLVNITKHVSRPDHQILTPREKLKVLKKYSIDEKQLPKMSKNDAIAKYYGLEKGQVVKISYVGGITDRYVTYRCVC